MNKFWFIDWLTDQGQIYANLFFRSGARNKARIISISKVEEPL